MALVQHAAGDIQSWAEKAVDMAVNKLSQVEDYLANEVLGGWTPAQIPDLTGKVALCTGANSGIGLEACRKLAENGAKVYLVAKDHEKGAAAVKYIKEKVGTSADVHVLTCDVGVMENVLRLISEFKSKNEPLHILINNAGLFFPGPFAMTRDNLEQTMAVNLYAPVLLMLGLLDVMAPDGRIVNMSSEGEGPFSKFDLQNLRGDRYKDSGAQPYGTSKLYLIMVTRELATRIKYGDLGKHVDAFAVQPGLVNTPGHNKMDRKHYLQAWQVSGLGKTVGQTPYHGAWSTLYAATEPSLTGKAYAYIGPNWFGMYHHVEREPGNLAGRNPTSCWSVFEGVTKILRDIVGPRMPPVPQHPNDVVPLVAAATRANGTHTAGAA